METTADECVECMLNWRISGLDDFQQRISRYIKLFPEDEKGLARLKTRELQLQQEYDSREDSAASEHERAWTQRMEQEFKLQEENLKDTVVFRFKSTGKTWFETCMSEGKVREQKETARTETLMCGARRYLGSIRYLQRALYLGNRDVGSLKQLIQRIFVRYLGYSERKMSQPIMPVARLRYDFECLSKHILKQNEREVTRIQFHQIAIESTVWWESCCIDDCPECDWWGDPVAGSEPYKGHEHHNPEHCVIKQLCSNGELESRGDRLLCGKYHGRSVLSYHDHGRPFAEYEDFLMSFVGRCVL